MGNSGNGQELHESAEDYLEKILMLKERLGQVRSIDIATELGYSKPSISIAMKKLRESGYIQMDNENLITLTESGQKIAKKVYNRHVMLTKLLMSFGVSSRTAEEDACKIEHDLSEESMRRIKEYLKDKN